MNYCHQDFGSYQTVPSNVVTADLLLSEYYASNAIMAAKSTSSVVSSGGLKSETFDDYSYTVADSASVLDEASLDLASLLDEYVVPVATGNTFLRMRKL